VLKAVIVPVTAGLSDALRLAGIATNSPDPACEPHLNQEGKNAPRESSKPSSVSRNVKMSPVLLFFDERCGCVYYWAGNCRRRRSVSDRLNGRRRKERKLVQGGANRVLKLDFGNVEDFRADLGREAHQNSKNKAVPQQRRQQKKAAKFRRKQFDPVESMRRFHSSSNRRPDDFNQKAAMG
jgi:hypothetical protein